MLIIIIITLSKFN